MKFSSLSAVAALISGTTAASLPTISTKGQYFFTSNGDRWFVKGIAYQLSPSDPLLDATQCQLDATLMQSIGTNAIRVYHVESGVDHSACMKVFNDAGIYIFVDLDTFTTQIEQTAPSWTTSQQNAFEAVMDDFQQYTNTAGFFIGNEVLTDPTMSEVAPFIKAATKDLKAYSASKGYRTIPIGYSHADITTLRPTLQNYLACGDSSASIDFFGLNSYEWCGSNTFQGSGYANLTSQIMDYPIPVIMSETGCIQPEPRLFQDQSAMYGPEMTPYWSGAIIYEWIQEVNHYGIITYGDNTNAYDTSINPNDVTRSGTPTPVTPDFTNLKTQWATLTPTGVSMTAYTPSNSAPTCPSYTSGLWDVHGNVPLPTLNEVYNSAVQYSISAGHLQGQAPEATSSMMMTSGAATTTGSGSGGSATGSAASASSTQKGSAGRSYSSSDRHLVGMGAGLASVMLGFIYWL